MISLGGIVVSQSIRVGGDEMDDAIVDHCKNHHKLMIGQQTAEEVKLETGSATPLQRGGQDRDPRPRHRLRPPEDGHAHLRGGPHRARRARQPDRRRGQGDARPHPARARRRHHGPRHHPGRRRLAASGLRRAPARGVPDARAARRLAAYLRRRRLGPLARGVRDDPPRQRSNSRRRSAARSRAGRCVPQAGTQAPRRPRRCSWSPA